MNTPKFTQSLRFYSSIWMLAIILIGCVPVQPEASIPASASAPASVSTNVTSVGILVVDFFDPPGPILLNEDNRNCLAGPNGYGQISEGANGSSGSTGATEDIQATTTIPHGDLVYAHLLQQFGSGFTPTDENPGTIDGLIQLDHGTIGTQDVYLAKIDIGTHYTDEVLNQIAEVRAHLQTLGVEHFVVNISVVVKRCEPLFDEQGENFGLYIEFVKCIESLNNQRIILNNGEDIEGFNPEVDPIVIRHANVVASYYGNVLTRETSIGCPTQNITETPDVLVPVLDYSLDFYRNLTGDPLIQTMQGISTGVTLDNTFLIAAAGNDGYPFPYAPAIFRHIVSTGAISGTMPVVNKGEWGLNQQFEWIVEGGTIDLKTQQPNGSVTLTSVGPGEPVVLTGTSFAAPKLSYLTAMALVDGSPIPTCYPDMTSAAIHLPKNWDNWSTISGVNPNTIWKNLGGSDLMGVCPDFPDPSTTTPPS